MDVSSPTDSRVGEESLEQPWLRGMRLRLCPGAVAPPVPARTLWAPELMVLRAVVVSTRPGDPLRLPAALPGRRKGRRTERKDERERERQTESHYRALDELKSFTVLNCNAIGRSSPYSLKEPVNPVFEKKKN